METPVFGFIGLIICIMVLGSLDKSRMGYPDKPQHDFMSHYSGSCLRFRRSCLDVQGFRRFPSL